MLNQKQRLNLTPSLRKIKFNTVTPQRDCYYCLMKQKFNVGNSGNAKCLQHTIANRQQQKQCQNSSQFPLNLDQIIDLLKKIDQGIEYHLVSSQSEKNNENNKLFEQIYIKINKIYEKISKCMSFSSSKYNINQSKYLKNLSTTDQINSIKNLPLSKIQNQQNRSYYYQNNGNSIFLYQESEKISTSDVLKQWLMHFHKLLITKNQKQQSTVLAQNLFLSNNFDLQIFKESMQRKFIKIKQKQKILEKRLSLSLQKLLFYMQKSEGIVPSQKIQSDILFLQENQQTVNQMLLDQNSVQKLLLSQALTIEALLTYQQKQLSSYFS